MRTQKLEGEIEKEKENERYRKRERARKTERKREREREKEKERKGERKGLCEKHMKRKRRMINEMTMRDNESERGAEKDKR